MTVVITKRLQKAGNHYNQCFVDLCINSFMRQLIPNLSSAVHQSNRFKEMKLFAACATCYVSVDEIELVS